MPDSKERYIYSDNLNRRTDFPYLVLDVANGVPSKRNAGFHVMHWHDDLQFICALEGSLELQTLDLSISLASGEVVYINKDVVHRVQNADRCHYVSIIFPPYFLTFYPGSPACALVDRVTSEKDFDIVRLMSDSGWQDQVLAALKDLLAVKPDAHSALETYEVLVRLSEIWLLLCKNITIPLESRTSTSSLRVQKVLRYMEEHYSDPLTLEDLSRSASISKSECIRCFRDCLSTTPYRYLTEIRLSKAAQLLKETDLPIGSVSEKVGFQEMSHFGKCFKERTGFSPREYRKANPM